MEIFCFFCIIIVNHKLLYGGKEMRNNNIDIATKYQVELNSKYSNYSKQSSSGNGTNTAKNILNIIQQQSNTNNNKNTESE